MTQGWCRALVGPICLSRWRTLFLERLAFGRRRPFQRAFVFLPRELRRMGGACTSHHEPCETGVVGELVSLDLHDSSEIVTTLLPLPRGRRRRRRRRRQWARRLPRPWRPPSEALSRGDAKFSPGRAP